MSRRHPSSSCGVGARAGGYPRDAPPHPFKVKLGDHFSAAPEITPGWGLAPGCGTHGTPHRCRSELVGLPRQYTTISATMQLSAVPRPRPSCNSRKRTLKDVIDVCDNFVNELEARPQNPLSVRGKVHPELCGRVRRRWLPVLLLIGRSQRLKKTETSPKETTKGPRPGPDHLPEEPAFITFLRERERFGVRGLSPTFSRRSTVSQRLGACGSVASGALRTFLSATCGTPCEKTKPTEVTNR